MKGILLVNIGSPISKSRKDVKSFVGAMLSDPKVMTVPDWFRPILVKGLILPLRQFASAKKYSLIWNNELDISPLLYHMEQLEQKLTQDIEMPVGIGMRYESPSIQTALKRLAEHEGLTELIVLPMFPHFAESSYGTAVNELKKEYEKEEYPFSLTIIEPYFNHPAYIEALAKSIQPYVEQPYDRLVFAYHSLPLSHIEDAMAKGREFDYIFQTKETTKLLCEALAIDINKTRQVYSSAMGSKWLEPSLDSVIKQLGEEKSKRVLVVSAGFSVDNLETLFDVGIQTKEIFIKAGGGKLEMIPCLNSSAYWVDAIRKIVF